MLTARSKSGTKNLTTLFWWHLLTKVKIAKIIGMVVPNGIKVDGFPNENF